VVDGVGWLTLKFYEFYRNSEGTVGYSGVDGKMQARNSELELELTATTDLPGTYALPTDKGLVFACRDTMQGQVNLKLRSRRGGKISTHPKASSSLWQKLAVDLGRALAV